MGDLAAAQARRVLERHVPAQVNVSSGPLQLWAHAPEQHEAIDESLVHLQHQLRQCARPGQARHLAIFVVTVTVASPSIADSDTVKRRLLVKKALSCSCC